MKKNWKETLLALVFIGSVFMFLSLDIKAAPYVEYKHKYDVRMKDTKDTYLRLGYKGKKMYAEIGKDSAEIGYKLKIDKIVFKGKAESTNDFKKTSLETEVRYTF